MTINPIAMGMDVVPLVMLAIPWTNDGAKYPNPIPTAMARNIQSVRKRSRNESLSVNEG
jgi:hypothetical protein